VTFILVITTAAMAVTLVLGPSAVMMALINALSMVAIGIHRSAMANTNVIQIKTAPLAATALATKLVKKLVFAPPTPIVVPAMFATLSDRLVYLIPISATKIRIAPTEKLAMSTPTLA
jgi:hypothetical protein